MVVGKKVAQGGGFAVADQFSEIGYQERMSHGPYSGIGTGTVARSGNLYETTAQLRSEKLPTEQDLARSYAQRDHMNEIGRERTAYREPITSLAHTGSQDLGNVDQAIGSLVVFHDDDQCAAEGDGRSVERVDEAAFLFVPTDDSGY